MRTSMKNLGKRIASRASILRAAHLQYCLAKNKKKFAPIESAAAELEVQLIGPKDFQPVDHQRYNACHIIGSGWSLKHSLDTARRPDAFVVGFNFSCLSGLRFNSYFVEFGGEQCAEIANAQVRALDAFLNKSETSIYFKNLADQKNNLSFALDCYGDRVSFLRDVLVACPSARYLNETAKILMQRDSYYLRQYSSTILSAIAYAKNLGFSTIVLHGVDFGGDYFFDLPEFSRVAEFRPPATSAVAYSSTARTGGVHVTSQGGLGVVDILPSIKKSLSTLGIGLFCATALSPSSSFLDVHG